MRDDTTQIRPKTKKPYKRGNKFKYEPDPHEDYYAECDREDEENEIYCMIQNLITFLHALGIKNAVYFNQNDEPTDIYYWQFHAKKYFFKYTTRPISGSHRRF